jgi:nicotinamidase-related amidase
VQTALVVVDMLNDFIAVDGALGNPAAREIIGPISSLAERARAADDWIVFYANDAHHVGDVELQVFPPHAMVGTPGAAVIDDLRPGPDDVVVQKRFYSAFTETEFHDTLSASDVGRLVLVGQHTDCCIRHTAYDAFVRGYEIVVCRDATTVFGPQSQDPLFARQQGALEYLRYYYGARLETAMTVG